jgi:hypothetical protein
MNISYKDQKFILNILNTCLKTNAEKSVNNYNFYFNQKPILSQSNDTQSISMDSQTDLSNDQFIERTLRSNISNTSSSNSALFDNNSIRNNIETLINDGQSNNLDNILETTRDNILNQSNNQNPTNFEIYISEKKTSRETSEQDGNSE